MMRWLWALAATVFVAVAAGNAFADERVLSFDSDITVHPDGAMTVSETIRVRAENNRIRHGIYRDFPTEYVAPGTWYARRRVPFELVRVTRDGRPEDFHLKALDNGKRVYMGREGVTLRPGEYTYALTYTTARHLGFFADHDELYWNVTGNGWDFTIDKTTAKVHLPEGAPAAKIKVEAYTGKQGDKGKAYRAAVDKAGVATFATTAALALHEGLTIVVSWPKGIVHEPTESEKLGMLFLDNRGILIGLGALGVALLYFLIVWSLVGRDTARGTIIPRFTPPDGFSPPDVRFLAKMRSDDRCVAAAVVDMAVKGYLTISEEKGEYTLKRTDAGDDVLSADEKALADLFCGKRSSMKLTQSNHRRISSAIKAFEKQLNARFDRTYFIRNSGYMAPGIVLSLIGFVVGGLLSATTKENMGGFLFMCAWLGIWSIGVGAMLVAIVQGWRRVFARGPERLGTLGGTLMLTLFSLPFLGGEVMGIWFFIHMSSPLMLVVLALAVVLNVAFHHLLKRYTPTGRARMDEIEGLRMYLGTAERERLNVLYELDHSPATFEKYLPYALALGVENRWAEQFADVIDAAAREKGYSPGWYDGASWTALGAAGFASAMGGSLSGSIRSASTAPGASSGGGGGGSSGGGGGGGGGGGW